MAYIMNFINGTTGDDNLTSLATALDDSINGGLGADTMAGGLGNDTYVVDNLGDVVTENASEGTDTVQSSVTYTLGANVERLTLTGSAAINGTGNGLDNLFHGETNSAANVLAGGAGNDAYYVGAGDSVVENAGEGADTVYSTAGSFNLELNGANIENLYLGGTGATGIGNALDNVIGGTNGADVLDGRAGADSMNGGLGGDTYNVDNTGDVVQDVAPSVMNSGIDTVIASVNYTLSATSGVENLTLTGAATIGVGNNLNNVMTGNGHAALDGGAGNDTYVVSAGDTVSDSGGIDTIKTDNATLADLRNNANIENVTLTGAASTVAAYGNASANILRGDGNGGANVLTGGAGDDTYYLGAGDSVAENGGEGTDTVYRASSSTLLDANVENLVLTSAGLANGNGGANTITGTSGADTIDGKAGADRMIGGAGNDTYIVDDANDVVIDSNSTLMGNSADKVISSVNFDLSNSAQAVGLIENLTLSGAAASGTGNSLNNVLTNSTGHAVTLNGGAGNDTYIVSTGDTVNDTGGVDTIQTANATLADLRGNVNIENVTLTSGAGGIAAYGNGGANVLRGDAAGTGNNALYGGAGNDTYYVGAGDTVVENATAGTDTVFSSVTFTLGTDVENLTLTGNFGLFGTGNDGDNAITGSNGSDYLAGGAGNDRLAGGLGNDVLYGGAGNDTFVFNTNTFAVVNRDQIADFAVGADKIELAKSMFGTLTAGSLASSDFTSGAGMTSGAHIVLNTTNGMLYYDADGTGVGAGVAFAQFTNSVPTTLSASDFTVV
jgi:Ca2+-binding RTX toxin-like protein